MRSLKTQALKRYQWTLNSAITGVSNLEIFVNKKVFTSHVARKQENFKTQCPPYLLMENIMLTFYFYSFAVLKASDNRKCQQIIHSAQL